MTFISYPDITAVSPGRRFRVEIRGTSADHDFFRDQSGFVYRLFEAATETEVWRWSPTGQVGLADYPHEAWVNDDGWVVARWHHWFDAGLLVISPSGKCRMFRRLQSLSDDEAGLLENESDLHIGGGSAGPNWESSSIALFHQHRGRDFWSILTWWGRRIVIDLEAGAAVAEMPDAQKAVVEELERAWILDQLQRAQSELRSRDESDPHWWRRVASPAYAAAFQAGRLEVQEAAPLLRGLEANPIRGSSTSVSSWIDVDHLPFRWIAKISLLRLGIEPRWIASFILTRQRTGQRCLYPEYPEERKPHMIEEGMSQRAMLERVGVPEFLRDDWDYCLFDHGRVYTMRVHWHDKHRVNVDWQYKQGVEKFRQEFETYRAAVDREPPVADRIEHFDRPPWSVSPIRESAIAHETML